MDKQDHAGPRKPRADAQRNRERLLAAAKVEFAARGASASLEQIARSAGVGIGTLYRRFPTRDDLIEAVYRVETDKLTEAANRLAATQPPVEALRAWMRLCIDYFETKQGMAEALNSVIGGTARLYAATGMQATQMINMLAERAVASGDLRLDIDPSDLLRAVAGVGNINAGPNWKEAAYRLVDILIEGLRVRPSSG